METRSIFENLKVLVQVSTDALSKSAEAVGEVANTAHALSSTGTIMAESNKRIVSIKTAGEEAEAMVELREKYPDLNMDDFFE